MAGEGTSGAVIGGMLALRDRNIFLHRDIREQGHEIDQNAEQIRKVRRNGTLKRGAAALFSDFMVGINLPISSAPPSPAPFATIIPPITRPALNDVDLLYAVNAWPMPQNAYNADGYLQDPSDVQGGGMVLVGQALGYSENLAVLMGHTRTLEPSNDQLTDLFRHYQGLRIALDEILSSAGTTHSQAFFSAAWRRFFANIDTAAAFPSGLVWSLTEDSNAVTSSTVEQVLYDVPFPPLLLAPGEVAQLDFSTNPETVSATPDLTLSVYFNGILVGTLTEAGVAGQRGIGQLLITRRADGGGLAIFSASGFLMINGTSQVMSSGSGIVSFNHSLPNVISIRGQWSTGSANSVRLASATLRKL